MDLPEAQGRFHVPAIALDVRQISVAVQFSDRRNGTLGFLVLSRGLTEHDTGTQLLCSGSRPVKGDRFHVTYLLGIHPFLRSSAISEYGEPQANNGQIVVCWIFEWRR